MDKEVINSTVTGDNPEVSYFIEDWALVQDGLFKVFNKYSESFLSSLLKGVVSGGLMEIIKSMFL